MTSKSSRWFQNCWRTPDSLKTFWTLSKLSRHFQMISNNFKIFIKNVPNSKEKTPSMNDIEVCQKLSKICEEHVLKEESMFSFSSRTMITQYAFCGFVVSNNHPYFGIVMRNSYARFVQKVFAREKLLSRKFLYSRQSHYPPWFVQKVSKPNEPRSVSPVFCQVYLSVFFYHILPFLWNWVEAYVCGEVGCLWKQELT